MVSLVRHNGPDLCKEFHGGSHSRRYSQDQGRFGIATYASCNGALRNEQLATNRYPLFRPSMECRLIAKRCEESPVGHAQIIPSICVNTSLSSLPEAGDKGLSGSFVLSA